jgi:tripartite ATP-independent transporter DctP family solute receptor
MKKITLIGFLLILGIGFYIILTYKNTLDNEDVIYFRLAEVHPENHPTTLAAREFARLVKEKTEGRIEIVVYDNEQLGGEKSVLEQVQFGAIDFARTSIAVLAEQESELNVLQLPYIYKDSEHMWRVLNSQIGDYFLDSIKDEGYIGIGWYDAGARNFYNSKKVIENLQDFEGLTFRVLENAMMEDIARAFGASAVRMPYEDVHKSIRTEIIDGAENNWASYDTSYHYEVAKYYTVNQHVRIPEILTASEKILDRISVEDLEIIKEAAKESQLYQRELWQEQEKRSRRIMELRGIVITEIKDKTSFIEAVQPIYEKYASDYMDMVEIIQNMK